MNMQAANVNVEFPSGTVRTVNLIVLKAQVLHAETMAKFGRGLTRNAPTLSAVRETYEIPASCARNWKMAAPLLRAFHADLSDALLAARA